MKHTNKILLGIVAVIAIYVILLFIIETTSTTTSGTGRVVCTMDAMQCLDGSYVGRTGPNCQFVCPVPVATSTPKNPANNSISVEVRLNQQVNVLGKMITPLLVLEDSRCPIDVQCIQAGTVRVRATLQTGLGITTQVFTLGKPVMTEPEEITLTDVKPMKNSKVTIKPGDYLFTFRAMMR